MHYAVPRILYAAGMLEHLYTDACAVKGWPRVLNGFPRCILPSALRRLSTRIPEGVPQSHITAFGSLGVTYALELMMTKSVSERAAITLWASKCFCNKVLERGLGNAQGIYAFKIAALELLQAARALGLRGVLEQISAPSGIWQNLIAEERSRFPKWELNRPIGPAFQAFCQRERAEWQSADVILCGSDYVMECIAADGGPVERCVVVPYGVDMRFRIANRRPHRPIHVLTVGTVNLNKGAPYVLEAAQRLKGKALFRMVGGIDISPMAERELRRHVKLTGLVPRSEIFRHYAWADVFLLPSICEGSATATYEALASGYR